MENLGVRVALTWSYLYYVVKPRKLPLLRNCQVSQFTLYATFKKGQKPDFHHAMESIRAKALYDQLLQQLRVGFQDEGRVKDGVFGAMMKVMIENDGPVTFELDSRPFEYNHSSSQRTGGGKGE